MNRITKAISIIAVMAGVSAVALSGCSVNITTGEDSSAVSEASSTVSEAASASGESRAEDNNSAGTDEATKADEASSEESSPSQNSVQIEELEYTEPDVKVEYIQVKGLEPEIQTRLNDNLESFYLWQWKVGTSDDTASYNGKAEYTLIGNRILSVRRYLSSTADGAAYPTEELTTQNFDLKTGDTIGEMNCVPVSKDLAEKFTLISVDSDAPAEVKEKAESRFELYLTNCGGYIYNYYLTDSGVAVFVNNDTHAEGDYFVFDTSYDNVYDILAEPIKAAVNP